MVRKLAGLAAGLALAIAIIMIVEAIGIRLYPPPRGYDLNTGSAESLPTINLVFPVAGWFLGALAGSWLAVHLARRAWPGWAVAGLVLVATILNFALITHPLWIMAAGALAAPLGGVIGQRLAGRTASP